MQCLQNLIVYSTNSFYVSYLGFSSDARLCFQVALPSQAVSVSVISRGSAVARSPLGVLVVPDGVSAVHIHPQDSHLPIFWSLNRSLSGDRVSLF